MLIYHVHVTPLVSWNRSNCSFTARTSQSLNIQTSCSHFLSIKDVMVTLQNVVITRIVFNARAFMSSTAQLPSTALHAVSALRGKKQTAYRNYGPVSDDSWTEIESPRSSENFFTAPSFHSIDCDFRLNHRLLRIKDMRTWPPGRSLGTCPKFHHEMMSRSPSIDWQLQSRRIIVPSSQVLLSGSFVTERLTSSLISGEGQSGTNGNTLVVFSFSLLHTAANRISWTIYSRTYRYSEVESTFLLWIRPVWNDIPWCGHRFVSFPYQYFESDWFEPESAAMHKYRPETSVTFRNFCFLPPPSSSVHTLKLTSTFTPTHKHVYS